MTIRNLIALLLLSVLALPACDTFDDLQNDPNRTTEATPGLLLTNIEVRAFNQIDLSAALASRYLVYTDGASDQQYYGWQRAGYGVYDDLRQVLKMEEEARRLDHANFLALARFFKSFFIVELTQVFGDVPYRQALQGGEGNFEPSYDAQADIYLGVLDDLKAAADALSPDGGVISGDVVYGGDVLRWRKLVNSFTLRVLMSLSRKEGNTTLNIRNRFREIVDNPGRYPIFTSNADQAALPFFDLEGNRYPIFNSNVIQTAYYLEETFVDRLREHRDPRLFAFADREPRGVDAGLPENDFNAYGGLRGSAPLDQNTQRLVGGEGSKIDSRYYLNPVNEPGIAVGFAELQFTLAEAAARGWIGGDAAAYYQAGIRASMTFYNVAPADVDAYLAQPAVQYDPARGLEMILTQKYLAFFLNSGWEPFFNQRRTGFPAFDVAGGGVLNNGRIPKRWMYPESEFDLNTANIEAAVRRQFPEGDDVNGVMWLLVEE